MSSDKLDKIFINADDDKGTLERTLVPMMAAKIETIHYSVFLKLKPEEVLDAGNDVS